MPDEGKIRGELNRALRGYWWPISQTNLRTPYDGYTRQKMAYLIQLAMRTNWAGKGTLFAVQNHLKDLANTPQPGRPDIITLRSTPVIECKMFDPPRSDDWRAASFSFKDIGFEQRVWLTAYMLDGNSPGAFLAIGTHHGRAGGKKNPRKLWVVPWAYWLQGIERVVRRIQDTLDLAVKPHLNAEIQEGELVAVSLLADYEMEWRDGGWQFPESHPLHHTGRLTKQQWSDLWTEAKAYIQDLEDEYKASRALRVNRQ